MTNSTDVEKAVKKLSPEQAQLMANLVLCGWVLQPTEGRLGDSLYGYGAWTAHLSVDTVERMEVALIHKDRFGLRIYSAPSLSSLLQQMQPVLQEFIDIETDPMARVPDAAQLARGASYSNRTTIITVTKEGDRKEITVPVHGDLPPP